MRLQLPIWARKRVAGLTVRVKADGIPAGASLEITDVQLQQGKLTTGPTPSVQELGVRAGGGRQYRNGVIHEGLEVVALANGDRAAPVRVQVRGQGNVRVGSFRFGNVQGTAVVDGRAGTATQGWGRAPMVTERADLWLPCKLDDRAHMRVQWDEMGD
ncbi:MAG: hypothetical protein QJR09_05225 [Micrococcus sp.]|nr:hypothetical protein [Micrococcus sp.]